MSSPWSLSASSGSSPWSASRVGTAAAAITPTGAVPPFGAALDLSTLPIDSDAFSEWARLQAEISRRDDLALAQANIDPAMHEKELELARNFEQSGLSMEDSSFSNREDDDSNWFMRRANDLQTYARQTRNVLGQGASFILAGPDIGEPDTWTYEDYRDAGGVLTETEWSSFSEATRRELGRRAKAGQVRTDVTETPGISHGLTAFGKAYQGATAAIYMTKETNSKFFSGDPLDAAKFYFNGDRWSQAWRESSDRTVGNAMVDSLLNPVVSDAQLDEWRKSNSVYQMSSVGAEIAALWYADAGVIAARGVGNTLRVARNEMPLRGTSDMGRAIRENMQGREVISVRTKPAQKYASWRANRMLEGRAGVEDYARNTDFATFARLPMFHNRATDGVAAAKAIHIAAQSDNPDLMHLTWGVLNNDPHAFARVDALKRETPENLLKYDPNASTFLNAMEATKTRASVLQQELDDLAKVDPSGSPFHRWELDTDIKIREDQLARAETDLRANLEYADWLELMGTKGLTQDSAGRVLDMGDPYHPRVERIQAPKREKWNDVEETFQRRGPMRRMFMSNQFGYSHEVVRWSRNTWMNKAGTISFHDLDSGPRNIDRYFEGLDMTLGYKLDPTIRADVVDRFVKAPTPQEKYRVLYEMEDLHLIPAMANKLGVDPITVKAIWDKVNSERGRTYDGVMSGKGRVYSTAPSLGQRVGDEFHTAKLVSEPDDQGMVTLELMDGQKRTTVTVHESALQKRVTPEDVTQTVNYYQPADIRQLYYELKRHPELLADIDANLVRYGASNAAALIDTIGTKFYSLWKPMQLWRPGWPQRVLMDEGLRAAAIFGPMYWITGEGAKALGTGIYNLGLHSSKTLAGVPGWVKAKFDLRSHHKWLNDGPMARYQKATPDPIRHDVEVTTAPKFPASEFPAVNKSRFDRINKIATAYSLRNHSDDAWRLSTQEQYGLLEIPDNITPENIERHRRLGDIGMTASRNLEERELEVAKLGRPLDRMVEDYDNTRGRIAAGSQPDVKAMDMPAVYDVVTGQRLDRGFFVPLPHIKTDINFRGQAPREEGGQARIARNKRNFHYWVEQNAELLSRQGIRTYIDPEGNLGVGLWVGQSTKKSGSPKTVAANALRRVAESAPLEVDPKTLRMFDLDNGHAYYAQSRDTLSPMQEALYRYFQGQEGVKLDPDLAPAPGAVAGEPVQETVFHGTTGSLPEELLPRDTTGVANGRMVGPGFYTTVDPEIADSYSWGGELYHVRSSRTGQTYEVFDVDKEMTAADFEELTDWLRANMTSYDADDAIWEVAEAYKLAESRRLSGYRAAGRKTSVAQGYFRTRIHPSSKKVTWGNVWENIDDYTRANNAVTDFLEAKGYGALTHRGGNQAGKNHQVFVWFHPEDLEVKPLYVPDGDFTPLERWFADPRSVDMPLVMNQVPESRIVRFGKRNPMLRQLHELHAKRVALEEKLGLGVYNDSLDDLIDQELSIMQAMGLEFRGRTVSAARAEDRRKGVDVDRANYDHTDPGAPNAFGQDWYEVRDADAFNRMVNEAEGINGDFDWAAAANGDLRKQELAYLEADKNMNLEDMDLALDDPVRGMYERMKKKYGAGHMTIEGADGQQFHLPNFYEGHEGEINRALTSSSKTIDNISDGHGGALQYLRTQAAGHKTYHPPVFNDRTVMRGTKENAAAVQYFDIWSDMLNDQVGNSPIWRRMLTGQSDERIVDWLENTPEGNRVRAEIMPDHKSVELWVNEHRAKLDYYLPNRRLQRLLGKRRLTPAELRRGIHDDDMPDVFGPDLEVTKRAPWTRLADKMWNGLGTIPIDALSRQPFAKAVFDARVQALVGQMDRKYLDEAAVGRIYAEARRHTLNEVRKTLYDLSDGTNLTDMLRFIAPFWNAQQEALMKWARIVSDRPETVARFFVGTRAIYRNFVVVDEENNEVEDASRKGGLFDLGLYQPSDKVIFNIPEWVRDTPLGKALGSVGSVRIPIGSANTVLQGEMPLFPSTGPLITMPVDKFLKTISDTDGTTRSNDLWYRWLFPIGRPSEGTEGVLEQLFPGWGRRLLDATGPADDLGRANLAWSVGREMILEARREGKPVPTQHEINKAANFLWGLRAFTSWASPVQMEFAPQHQFWLDQAHRYREQYGQDYFDQFLADYGKEAAYYAISSSNSLAHVPPTNQGMEEWSQNKDLIQKFPDFGGMIISPDAYTEDYSQDAYRAQFDIQLGPLDSRKLRSIQDPQARMNEGERLLGWQEFRKVQAAVDAALMERGLTSIQSQGAEDLKLLKSSAMSDLRDTYPAWAADFDVFANDIDSKVKQLESFAFNREFDSRPDFAGLRQYLVVRAQAAAQLDAAYVAGGSRSLQAEENAALASWFYDQTGQIVQSNPAFAELYARYLTGDTLMRGSG